MKLTWPRARIDVAEFNKAPGSGVIWKTIKKKKRKYD
jgi:hypothetical protein